MFHFHLTSLRCQDCENGGSQTVNISNIKGGGPPAPRHMLVYTSHVQYKEFLYHSGRYKNYQVPAPFYTIHIICDHLRLYKMNLILPAIASPWHQDLFIFI